MFFALKTAYGRDGEAIGVYVSAHNHEEQTAVWAGETFPDEKTALEDLAPRLGTLPNLTWQDPDADAAPDVLRIARDTPPDDDNGKTMIRR